MNKWIWKNSELVKSNLFCKVGRKYPKNCDGKVTVCDPVADSFGDICGFKGCKKIS